MAWYEWVFSGIGVTVSGYLFRRAFKEKRAFTEAISGKLTQNSKSSASATSIQAPFIDSQVATGSNITQRIDVHHHYGPGSPPEALRPTKLLPHQIRAELEALAPFDRLHAREKYIGLEIVWPLEFHDILDMTEGYRVIFIAFGRQLVQATFRQLPPDIKVSQKGARFWIHGRIERVYDSGVVLRADPNVIEEEEIEKPDD